jgi:ParB/RepB/Spo0J family partition protein
LAEYREIDIGDIIVTGDNPRKNFDEEKLRELGTSMIEDGQLQEVWVRPLENGRYQLVIGERRYRAAKLIGIEKLRARIEDVDDARLMEIRLLENTQREDLTDAEKGNAVAHLLEKYEDKYPTIVVLAQKLHKTYSLVNTWLQKSERLSAEVKKLTKLRKLSEMAARYLLKYDFETQDKLAHAIIDYGIKSGGSGVQLLEFFQRYDESPNKYPTVESLQNLANEVKGVKKVKIDLAKLSPEARAEVEKTLEEAKEEAKKLRARRPKRPRRSVRRQGRPKKTEKQEPKAEIETRAGPIPEPTVPIDVRELTVGSLWLPIPLYEKVFELSAEKQLTIPETVIYIVRQYFGEQ